MLRERAIYVGIYSSALETKARAEDEDGKLLGTASCNESININISIKHAWEVINRMVDISLERSEINPHDPSLKINVGLGIKNTELAEACIELKRQNNRFQKFTLATDGYVLLRSSHTNDGAIIILDDGIVGNAIKGNQLIKIGGWGFPHADKGSRLWIGLEAIIMTIQWLDGFLETSPLLTEIFHYFKNDISNLVEWAMYSRTDPRKYNSICEMVLSFIEKGDKNSIALIKHTASETEKLFQKLLEKSKVSSIPCTLHGRLLPYVEKYLSDGITKNIIASSGDGTTGAIALIRKETEQLNSVQDYIAKDSRDKNPLFTG